MKHLTAYFLLCFLPLLFIPSTTEAHAPGQSYIYLRIFDTAMEGTYQMNISDINVVLESQFDDNTTLAELNPRLGELQNYFLEQSSFAANGKKYDISFETPEVLLTEAGLFLLMPFKFNGVVEVPDAIDIKFNFLFEQIPSHSNWLMIENNWKAGIFNNERIPSLVYGPNSGIQTLDLSQFTLMRGFLIFIYQGMKHIWIGFDHILFLVALLLSAVITRRPGPKTRTFEKTIGKNRVLRFLSPLLPSWAPVKNFKSAFINMIKIVTFFTIAHSITLSIAALEIIQLPGRIVESIIALSIALAAYHNFRPIFKQREWLIVFGFGLFHGFGFASVLGDLGVTGEHMLLTLLGFNIGVEIGQIVIICLTFPILFAIRKHRLYPYILTFGSIALILLSLYWFAGRAFDFEVYGENITEKIYRKIERLFLSRY